MSQFPQTFLTNPSKLRIYCENSFCDHRNFDSVIQTLSLLAQILYFIIFDNYISYVKDIYLVVKCMDSF